MEFIKAIILICCISEVCCPEPWYDYSDDRDLPTEMFFIFSTIFLAAYFILLIKKFKIPIPYTVFLLLGGVILGLCRIYSTKIKLFTSIMDTPTPTLLLIFLPPLVFKTTFSIDVHTFNRSWLQILIISTCGLLINATVVGILMCYVMELSPTYKAVTIGILNMPIFPLDVVRILRDIGYQTKHLTSLLEGESVFGLSTVILIFRVVIAYTINKSFKVVSIMFVWSTSGGIVAGLLAGKLTAIIISNSHNSPTALILWTLVIPYSAYIFCERVLQVCGVLCVVGIGIFVSVERLGLPSELDLLLTDVWDIVSFVVHGVTLTMLGIYVSKALESTIRFSSSVLILVTYLAVMLGRALGILALSPILSRIGYGLSFQEWCVLVWGGIRGIFGAILACELERETVGIFYVENYLHLSGVLFLTLIINAPTMKLLLRYFGVADLSLARKTNMNNCMKHILAKRERAIVTLKMDRFLSDANWPLIYSTTIMKHPYKTQYVTDDDEDKIELYGEQVSKCPECGTDVPNEPSGKDLKDMTREARLRILKAKKISYMKQYEYGMLSKEGLRVLSSMVEIASDSDNALIDLDMLYKLFRKQGIMDKIRFRIVHWMQKHGETDLYPPRKYWRRVCYHIVTHNGFDIFMSIVILLNIIPIAIEMALTRFKYKAALIAFNTLFFLLYFFEFLLKIWGYSWIYICKHGFRTYFRSVWNIFDFVVLIFASVDLSLDYADLAVPSFTKVGTEAGTVMMVAKIARIVRIIRLFKLCQAWHPNIIRYCDSKIDARKAFAYEVGKGFVNGEEEVLDVLPQMVEYEAIRDDMKRRMEEDKLAITRELGLIQKERPWIAITVKSKQAMRSTLNSIREAITELKVGGWLDDYENVKFQEAVHDSLKTVKNIKSIPQNSPEVIFKEVPWMAADAGGSDYLYKSIQSKVLDTGAFLCRDGEISQGIYILITGLLKLKYTPKDAVLDAMLATGALPIVDCIMGKNFEDKIEDYLVSGNTIGELCTLTQRPYNCDVTAETPSEVFFLPRAVVMEMIHQDVDEIQGWECRMWKSLSLRLALAILVDVPAYQSQRQDFIKLALERAFVPKLDNYKIFAVSSMIEDIILIEGIAIDGNTNEVYVGPCYIHRTVQKLVLPQSSQYHVTSKISPKLMIIPVKDQDEYELMEATEHLSELVNSSNIKIFHQSLQARQSRVKKKKKPANVFQRKAKANQSFSTKSAVMKASEATGAADQFAEEEEELAIHETIGFNTAASSEYSIIKSERDDSSLDQDGRSKRNSSISKVSFKKMK